MNDILWKLDLVEQKLQRLRARANIDDTGVWGGILMEDLDKVEGLLHECKSAVKDFLDPILAKIDHVNEAVDQLLRRETTVQNDDFQDCVDKAVERSLLERGLKNEHKNLEASLASVEREQKMHAILNNRCD